MNTVKHLLIFNLATDADDGVLGFTTRWINEFAKTVPKVTVVTMRAGRLAVAPNVRVYSVGREHGWSEPRRAWRFYHLLWTIFATDRVDACFSHMMPLFSWMAGPLLRAQGIPLITWYAHPRLTWSVRLADVLSDYMVSSVPNAYPHHRRKLAVIGQGIDAEVFTPGAAKPEPYLLCAGRISRVKNHITLLRAFRRLLDRGVGAELRLVIVGARSGGDAEQYFAELESEILSLGMEERVRFLPPMPQAELVAWYQRCLLHVNLTPAGFGDKVAWEAMSCGAVCLVGNPDFRETLGVLCPELLFANTDEEQLAELLQHWIQVEPEERVRAGRYLRRQVQQLHSIGGLVDRVLGLAKTATNSACPLV